MNDSMPWEDAADAPLTLEERPRPPADWGALAGGMVAQAPEPQVAIQATAPETPVNVDELPFLAQSSDVIQSEVPTFFPRTLGTVQNADGSVVFQRQSDAPGGGSMANHEFNMVPARTPVRNSDTAVVYAAAPEPEATPGTPAWASIPSPATLTNEQSPFYPTAGAPMSNDLVPGVVLGIMDAAVAPLAAQTPAEPAPAPVARGIVNVDQGSVTFFGMPAGAMQNNNDVQVGGGGDLTKQAREEEVSFRGQGSINVGGTHVTTALSGDTTKPASQEHAILAASASHLTNEAAILTETRDPTFNHDFREVKEGAVGEPLKR